MESSWFTVTDVWSQQQLRPAVASKGFHFWGQRHLVWVTRNTRMAGLYVPKTSHCHVKLFTQAAPYALFGNLPVCTGTAGCRVPSRARGTMDPRLPSIETPAAWICFLMCKKEGDKFPVFLFPSFSEFWCQSVMLMPPLRSRERRRDSRDTRQTLSLSWTQHGIPTDSRADEGLQLGK